MASLFTSSVRTPYWFEVMIIVVNCDICSNFDKCIDYLINLKHTLSTGRWVSYLFHDFICYHFLSRIKIIPGRCKFALQFMSHYSWADLNIYLRRFIRIGPELAQPSGWRPSTGPHLINLSHLISNLFVYKSDCEFCR